MAITVLSNHSERIFDPIRRRWVKASPEEQVRQQLIQRLLAQGVSAHHILVEVSLDRLPTGALRSCRGKRRIDLLVALFADGKFLPLLLAECKAQEPDERALSQLLAYQESLHSRWLVMAGPNGLWVYDASPNQSSAKNWSHEMPPLSRLIQDLVRISS